MPNKNIHRTKMKEELRAPRQILFEPHREKTCLGGGGGCDNTGADQPAHLRSLISALVIFLLKVSYVNLLRVKFQFSS